MQHLPHRSRSARNRGHAFVKRRSRFGEITGHDGVKYAASDARFCWADDLWNLIRKFDCHLVIHSSWRNSYTLDQLRDLLPTELGKRVVGLTVGENRHHSILAYVKKTQVKSYIILDDAADEFPRECVELLLCKNNMGISNPEIQNKLIQFLKEFCHHAT